MPLCTYINPSLDIETNDALKTILMNLFENKPGDWHVSIILSQRKNRWEFTITGPDDFEWRGYFVGPGEHNTNFIRSRIQEALEG